MDSSNPFLDSLSSYERVCRAALRASAGAPRVPILQPNDEQQAALYAPQQLENLVEKPLRDNCPCKNSI